MQKKTLEVEMDAHYVVDFFQLIFNESISFKIVVTLAKRDGANLREIARNVGISHKNLYKYLEELMRKGAIEAYPVGLRRKVYRLASKYEFLRDFLK